MLRIGLIADTHEANEPVALTDALTRLACDLHVHVGDVGGSREITAAVKQIKQYPDESVAGLPLDRLAAFQANLDQGLPQTRAYLDSVLASTPEARRARMAESADNYNAIVRRLAALADALCICGNTDRVLMSRNLGLIQPFVESGLPLITWPAHRAVNGHLLIFWPSLSREQTAGDEVVKAVDELLAVTSGYRSVVVIAHEQLFKGPAPAAYRRNALARGHRPVTIPHYEPSLSWRHLTRLLRGIPQHARLAYLHGHVHDANEVLGAGAPYLQRRADGGLGYRIRGGPEGPGRIVPSFSVPIDQLAVLSLSDSDFHFRAWRPRLPADESPAQPR